MIKVNRVNIKFSSVTYALRAKEIIEQNGGRAVIRKNPNPSRNEGCGYVIAATGNTEIIINLLNINKVKYIGYVFL